MTQESTYFLFQFQYTDFSSLSHQNHLGIQTEIEMGVKIIEAVKDYLATALEYLIFVSASFCSSPNWRMHTATTKPADFLSNEQKSYITFALYL